MTWSYDPGDLATSRKDQVRFTIGDTNIKDQQLADEEIDFALTLRTSIWGAAAECCRSLAAAMSRQADSVQADLRTTYSSRSRAYAMRAATLETFAIARSGGLPFAGGISIIDKIMTEQDIDRVPPQFQIGMEDNPLPVGGVGNESEAFPAADPSQSIP